MCVEVILIGVAQCVSPGSFNQWHTVQRNIFCFVHLSISDLFMKRLNYNHYIFSWLCKHFGLSLHKLLGVCVTTGNITFGNMYRNYKAYP